MAGGATQELRHLLASFRMDFLIQVLPQLREFAIQSAPGVLKSLGYAPIPLPLF
jgi:hypothetical protein